MIRFSCPHCRASIKAPPAAAGRSLGCPSCKQRVQIPSLTSQAPPPAAPIPAAPPPPPPRSIRRGDDEVPARGSPAKLAAIIAAGVVGVVVLVVAIVLIVGQSGGPEAIAKGPGPSEPPPSLPKGETPPPFVPVPIPPPPKVDSPEVADYKKAVRAFLVEVKVYANLLGLGPSKLDFDRQAAKVTDAFIRIPDPPPAEMAAIGKEAKGLEALIAVDRVYINLVVESLRIDSNKLAQENWDSLKKNGLDHKKRVASIESMLR